jgi:uncharacterized protein (TIGR03437 family)
MMFRVPEAFIMKKIMGLLLFSLQLLAADYTTYIGGTYTGISPSYDVQVTAMTTDALGNTYLTGGLSTDTLQNTSTPSYIAFVTKLDPTGQLVFSKAFGGSVSDEGAAIAVDPSGNIYVAGNTSSPDLLVSNALQTAPSGIFVLKLSPDGGAVIYLTYFGGPLSLPESVAALATDAKGNLYLTGATSSPTFPTTDGMPAAPTNLNPLREGAFISEISAAGDRILYSGVLAGSAVPCPPINTMNEATCGDNVAYTSGTAIAVDASGNAYVAGNTDTTDLPTTTGALASQGIGAFVVKINAGGTGIAYLTYVGGGNYFDELASEPANVVNALAVDSAGNAYLSGATSDPNFPATQGSYQPTLAASTAVNAFGIPLTEAFLAKLAPDASHMVWATYLGGGTSAAAQSIAVDPSGNVWTTGTTTSIAFPNTNGWSTGGDFLVEMNSFGAALLYAARYPTQTVAQAVALDPVTGLVHAAGPTGIVSGIAPMQTPTMRVFGLVSMAGGETSGRVAWGEMVSIFGPHIGPAVAVTGTADSSGALPTTLGGVQISFPGQGNASLLYVSDSQINAILPALNSPAMMQINNGGTTSAAFPVVPEQALPQVFLNANGTAAAVNQDGSLNSPLNPAVAGSPVTIWATGTGYLSVTAGEITTSANNSCNSQCQINVYGEVPGPFTQQATVLYAGASPGFASGFTEIVFLIPPQTISDFFTFNLSVNGFGSGPETLYVASQ